ncbi:cytochrome P450 [Streptomyces sp. NPDC020681]|uniref:cytochrome P450 n=1 Tax=Streptomyces sp. NPDC020681 TaxID=3365083 RepID=UPI003793A110
MPDIPETSLDEAQFPFPNGPHGSPPPAYAQKRATCPVAPVVMVTGDKALLATTYDDLREVYSDPRFSRNLRYPGAPRMWPLGADVSDDPNSLLNMDGPEHSRLRRIVQSTFTTRRAEAWRPQVQSVADELLDALETEAPPVDLIETFAFALPVRIICQLLGVPAEDSPRFRAWSDIFLSTSTADLAEKVQSAVEFAGYVGALIDQRRRAPGTGLLDELINACDVDDRLNEDELTNMVVGLIIAGHETTGNVIGRGILTLLQHPDQLAALRDDPGLLPAAAEEILRVDMPAHTALLRVATDDVPLPSGGSVSKGQAVIAPITAANFDPKYFPDPDTFNIRRAENKHVAFGHGPHFCLGAGLARVELQVAIASIIQRFPNLALACDPQDLPWYDLGQICGLERLPVTW